MDENDYYYGSAIRNLNMLQQKNLFYRNLKNASKFKNMEDVFQSTSSKSAFWFTLYNNNNNRTPCCTLQNAILIYIFLVVTF